MNKKIVIYSMKGCPHCEDAKKILKEKDIKFYDRDIDIYKKEYDLFSEAVENEYVPAFMLLNVKDQKNIKNVILLAPERDFDTLEDAIKKIENFLIKE